MIGLPTPGASTGGNQRPTTGGNQRPTTGGNQRPTTGGNQRPTLPLLPISPLGGYGMCHRSNCEEVGERALPLLGDSPLVYNARGLVSLHISWGDRNPPTDATVGKGLCQGDYRETSMHADISLNIIHQIVVTFRSV